MTEKIITVKVGKVISQDDKEWIELTDQQDKTHRVFKSIQRDDGTWCHLEKEIDMLKSKIQDGSINGLGLKLTKEKKGQFWNVVAVEELKDTFLKKAKEQLDNEESQSRIKSMCASYAKDIEVALIQTGKPFDQARLCRLTTLFMRLILTDDYDMEEVKDATKSAAPESNKETSTSSEIPSDDSMDTIQGWTKQEWKEYYTLADYTAWMPQWLKEHKIPAKKFIWETLLNMTPEAQYALKQEINRRLK